MLLQALKVFLKVSHVRYGTVELMGLKRSTCIFSFYGKGFKKRRRLDSGMRLSLSSQIMKLMTSLNLSRKTKA